MLSASACSVGASGTGSSDEGKTITVAVVNNPDMIRMEKLTPSFTKTSGIKVKYVTLPDQDLRQKVTTAAATKSGLYDVAMISPGEVQSGYASNGWILPLDDMFAKLPQAEQTAYDVDDLLPAVRDALSFNGKLYSLPFYGESNITYYRKDLFEKAGIKMPDKPTWSQIQEYAAKLHKPAAGQYGIVLKGIPQYGQLAPLMTAINSYGASWFDMSWKPQFTSPKFKQAVTDYVNLVRKYGEPGASSVGFEEGLNLMSQGKAAIWIDSTVAAGSLEDPKTSKVSGKLGWVQAPTQGCDNGSHWLYAWSLSIVNGSKNIDAAFQFIRWATSKDYVKLVAETDGWVNVPPGTRTSTYREGQYQKVAPFAQVTLDAMNSATNNKPSCQPVPYKGTTAIYIPEWADIGTQFAQGLSAVVSGKQSVDAWLQSSQAYAEKVMKQAGYYN
ncbi:MAG: sugar ABC transporter substrate-binding protein [Dactylosporangium sp.]|nr:sugar ABC transporter substrate-binding protein [Dactylosporangium sp.]